MAFRAPKGTNCTRGPSWRCRSSPRANKTLHHITICNNCFVMYIYHGYPRRTWKSTWRYFSVSINVTFQNESSHFFGLTLYIFPPAACTLIRVCAIFLVNIADVAVLDESNLHSQRHDIQQIRRTEHTLIQTLSKLVHPHTHKRELPWWLYKLLTLTNISLSLHTGI